MDHLKDIWKVFSEVWLSILMCQLCIMATAKFNVDLFEFVVSFLALLLTCVGVYYRGSVGGMKIGKAAGLSESEYGNIIKEYVRSRAVVARQSHNLEVEGSSPSSATNDNRG